MAGCYWLYGGHSEALNEAIFSVEVGSYVGASRGYNPYGFCITVGFQVTDVDDATVAVSGDRAVGSLQAISVFCCRGPSV